MRPAGNFPCISWPIHRAGHGADTYSIRLMLSAAPPKSDAKPGDGGSEQTQACWLWHDAQRGGKQGKAVRTIIREIDRCFTGDSDAAPQIRSAGTVDGGA
jgi:hypothetical protein